VQLVRDMLAGATVSATELGTDLAPLCPWPRGLVRSERPPPQRRHFSHKSSRGAVYLVYLGVQMLRASRARHETSTNASERPGLRNTVDVSRGVRSTW
jgi:hypothetical protein